MRYSGFDSSISDLSGQKGGPKYDVEEQEQAGEYFEREVVDVLQGLLSLHVGVVDVPVLGARVDLNRPADVLKRIVRQR